ncbi:hypothetical protein CGLO_10936 [Colletotrichum gloeosporioides Cg-14]|uniref:Uncharacterized protein n=1 Tax=Colletotrichum gloeosporioides (strain Cg-14) TaxID=1237896 RepID=T0LD94_COLGC|nr:hypothetical protein CGLO_10936 [Colletotrichum gloeosporioides Cg-14]
MKSYTEFQALFSTSKPGKIPEVTSARVRSLAT